MVVWQPHQQRLVDALPDMRYPLYIIWKMGSGKTIGALAAAKALPRGQRAVVLCDKSTCAQWLKEAARAGVDVVVVHYEVLDRDEYSSFFHPIDRGAAQAHLRLVGGPARRLCRLRAEPLLLLLLSGGGRGEGPDRGRAAGEPAQLARYAPRVVLLVAWDGLTPVAPVRDG